MKTDSTPGFAVAPKKVWANLAAQQQEQLAAQQQTGKSTKKKKSLMEIMAEEQEISKLNQQKEEDAELMRHVIQVSLLETQANKNFEAVNSPIEEDDIRQAIRLSTVGTEAKPATDALPLDAAVTADELASIEKAIHDAKLVKDTTQRIQLPMNPQEEDNEKVHFATATETHQYLHDDYDYDRYADCGDDDFALKCSGKGGGGGGKTSTKMKKRRAQRGGSNTSGTIYSTKHIRQIEAVRDTTKKKGKQGKQCRS